MEKRILTGSCILFFILTACFITISLIFPDNPGVAFVFAEGELAAPDNEESISVKEGEIIDSKGMTHEMRLEFPSNVKSKDVLIDADIVAQRINIKVRGIDSRYFSEFPIFGNGKGYNKALCSVKYGVGKIAVETDGVKDYKRYDEGRYVYLDFLNPGEKYDKIIVIDAGGGGDDSGSLAQGVLEKDLNLQILLKLKALFDEYNLNHSDDKIGVFYTRTEDVFYSLDERANFANNIGCDLFLSIQMNSTSSGRVSTINGTEVKYYSQNEFSKDFAMKIQEDLVKALGSGDRGILAGDDNLLLRKVKAPSAICGVGFMSNKEELKLLMDEEYQFKAAKAVFDTLVECINEDSYSDGK